MAASSGQQLEPDKASSASQTVNNPGISIATTPQDAIGQNVYCPAKSTLKVTLLGDEWNSSAGGLSTINRELAIHFSKHPKVEVSLLVPEGACKDEEKRAAQSCGVTVVDAKKRPAYHPLDWLSFPPPDLSMNIIVGHGVKLGRQGQVIRDSSRFHNCKWVQVVHTAPEDLSKYKSYADPISKGERKHQDEVDLCKMADLVVPVGPRLEELYSSYLQRCKKGQDIFSITPGLFNREFGDLKQAPNENADFKVLIFGRGDDEDFELKGYNIAAEAFTDQRLKQKPYHLMFVGAPDGKQEEVRQKLLQCGIADKQLTVRKFIQSRDRMKDLLCEADLAIMPSKSEGFGLVALEALSAGLPILVGSKSGFAKALENVPIGHSCIVDSDDPTKWAEAIEAVRVRHRIRLKEIKALRASYETTYCWKEQCEALVERMWRMVHGSSSENGNIPKVDSPAEQKLVAEAHGADCRTSEQQPLLLDEEKKAAATNHPGNLDSIIRLFIIPQDLSDEKQERFDGILKSLIQEYLKYNKLSDRDGLGALVKYLIDTHRVVLKSVGEGSLVIEVQSPTLESLESLWNDYRSGHLNEVAEKYLVTNEIKGKLNLETVRLKTTITEKNYWICKNAFIKQSENPTTSSPADEQTNPTSNPVMAQSKPIHFSVCKIRKQVPGNQLATAGSACVLEWPWELEGGQASQSHKKDKIFLVTTSQVVTTSELQHACTADFLPLKWGNTQTFHLNNLPFHEVSITGESNDISLILIPTEPLHKQNSFSRIRGNKFQSDRPQLCHIGTDLASQTAKANPDKLFCFVVRENGDKFDLQCYFLEVDESGSCYLQVPGNMATLRTLKDFVRNEFPKGSVILNENGEVVGFLGFGEKEILPVFLPQNLQGFNTDTSAGDNKKASNEKLMVNLPADAESKEDLNKNKEENLDPDSLTKKFLNRDSQEDSHEENLSFNTDTSAGDNKKASNEKLMVDLPADAESKEDLNKIKEENLDPDSLIKKFLNRDSQEDSDEENLITVNRPQLSQLSYVSMEREEYSYNGTETRSTETGNRPNQGTEAGRLLLQRCQSEKPLTPGSKRKMLQSSSEPGGPIALKSDTRVEKAILYRVYVMDALIRCLDTSYKKNVENWEHLANRQGVSKDLIMKLKCQSPASRSEELFQLLKATDPDLSIGTLKCHLTDLDMKNVVECIKDLNLQDDMEVDEVLESGNVPGRFFTLLDQKPEQDWNNLGAKLDVDHSILEGIKIDCATHHQNPAAEIIELIYTSQPTMTVGQFKKHLENIKRKDVKKKMDDYPDLCDKLTIASLRDNLDLMREVTRMLNGADNKSIKNFKDLAHECGISAERYRHLQPPCTESPTEAVLKDIVGRKPYYTVEELFTDLRDMERKDVIEEISPYFVEEDILALKRQLKISDE